MFNPCFLIGDQKVMCYLPHPLFTVNLMLGIKTFPHFVSGSTFYILMLLLLTFVCKIHDTCLMADVYMVTTVTLTKRPILSSKMLKCKKKVEKKCYLRIDKKYYNLSQ